MLSRLFKKKHREELKRAYEAGIAKGYELGYNMGKIERTNRGFIIASRLNQELNQILKEKEGK